MIYIKCNIKYITRLLEYFLFFNLNSENIFIKEFVRDILLVRLHFCKKVENE